MIRARFLGLLIFILLLLGLAGLRGALLALILPMLIYLLYGLSQGVETLHLEAQRTLSSNRVLPNTPVQVSLTLTNRGEALEELVVQDLLSPNLSVVEGSPSHVISLPKGGSYTFQYVIQGPRGGYALEELRVDGCDHFGLVRHTQRVRTRGQLFVFPPVVPLKGVTIRPRGTRVYSGTIPARLGGPGVEFFNVRDYQPGDPPRHINWHVSARQMEKLYSNEFQQERVADVAIVLDGRKRANIFAGERSLFEHSVLAVAALSSALLSQGDRVGLLIYGQYLHWTWPGYGKLQRERILQALAHARPGVSQVFDGLEYLPTRMFPSKSQIILVSALMPDDLPTLIQLRARGYQVLVVSPDPVAFELSYLPKQAETRLAGRIVRMERKMLLNDLQRAGIQSVEWDVSRPFDQATGRFLTGRRILVGTRL